MKSPILYNFEEFKTFMLKHFWNKVSPDDGPSSYPAIVINHYYRDYDNRDRDHLTIIELKDFLEYEECRHRAEDLIEEYR